MSSHKTYLLLLMLPYLVILIIFHIQLQIPVNTLTSAHHKQPLDIQKLGVSLLNSVLKRKALNFRDLKLKESSNYEQHTARDEYEKTFRKSHYASTIMNFDNDEQDHQVIAPQRDNENLARLIRVSRTFQNGSIQIKEVIRLLDETGERLELDGAIDSADTNAVEFVGSNIIQKITDQNQESIQFPYSQNCNTYFTTQELKADIFQDLNGIKILSAYMDARLPDEPPFVRMIGLLKRGRRPQLYCHFPQKSPGGTTFVTEVALFYEMCENHNKDYGGWIISCKVPSVYTEQDKTPCEVILSRRTSYNTSNADRIHVPIYTTQSQKDFETTSDNLSFAVCVPPLFGHLPSSTLVEFVELNRLLGVNHMIFYTHQVTSSIQKVLEYYQEQGLVTVISWDLPVQDSSIWYHGQLLAINDCLYRTMHRFSHVVFNDIDEFLVPHLHDILHGLVKHLERFGSEAVNDTKYSGFIFQSAFFDPLVNGNNKVLYDLESDLRTKIFSQVRTKVLVRPNRIFELGIHHISRQLKDSFVTESINPKVAFIHHYRKCTVDFDPRMKCHVYARDESISRYVPALRHNVHKTLWVLKELNQIGRH